MAQSGDNSLDMYSAQDKFRKNTKKSFKGHNTSGYGCKPAMSVDGKCVYNTYPTQRCIADIVHRYVVSGSSGGELVFWDWKTKRIFSRLRSHKVPHLLCSRRTELYAPC